jgi:hypothetical protein
MFLNDIEVGRLANGQQARRLIESAYGQQREAFTSHVLFACKPALGRTLRDLTNLGEPPARLRASLSAYVASLHELLEALAVYLPRVESRRTANDRDEVIPERARDWNEGTRTTPKTIAYDKFLRCAVPNLDTVSDGQALYRHLAVQCFQHNPIPFLEDLRRRCLPLLQNAQRGTKPDKAYRLTRAKLREQESRQARFWENCLELAEDQTTLQDAEEIVAATDHYLAARPR